MRVYGTLDIEAERIFCDRKKEIENLTRVVASQSQVLKSILMEFNDLKSKEMKAS